MSKSATLWIFTVAVFCHAPSAVAALVVDAEKAAIHTEGGPHAGGGWNLWSDGRVGQPLRFATAGTYGIVVRAWGSSAGGVWPEMALLVDGKAVKTVTVGRAERADYRFDVHLAAGAHEIAAGFLNDALIGKEDRNLYLERLTINSPPGVADPVLVAKQELAEAAEQRERDVVAATQAAIDKHRKVDAKIRILDAAGQPVPGVKVSVEQTSHDFLFGSNIYMFDRYQNEAQDAGYKQRFEELFNYATVGFYWRWYEPQRGKPNYDYTDKVIAWCQDHGIRMKGHPLLWGDQAGVPTWSKGQPSPEIQRQRVTEIMQRYRGKIEFWEVVNEPSHLAEPKIDEPYRWAREANPGDCLIVNDYFVLADGGPGFFRLLTKAKHNDVPFDGIGIQAHEPRTMRFPLDRVQEILDQYATLGKGLHITEFTPASSGQKITDSHRDGVWDEAAQADYAVKFYRVCFAHPAMRAITWWDLCDQGSWLPGGGMLRADMSPKPVYEQLRRLIHEEWKTSATATTDDEGRFTCRGFLGKYRLVIQVPDGKVERKVRLAKDGPPEIVVRLAASVAR
ncbi:MAG: endo-1,4-beta-xylanase [Planctomycetota bacterium]|nr:endo-1,4-beta-xylanase [Planctomycetota bacterium]